MATWSSAFHPTQLHGLNPSHIFVLFSRMAVADGKWCAVFCFLFLELMKFFLFKTLHPPGVLRSDLFFTELHLQGWIWNPRVINFMNWVLLWGVFCADLASVSFDFEIAREDHQHFLLHVFFIFFYLFSLDYYYCHG